MDSQHFKLSTTSRREVRRKRITRTIAYVLAAGMITGSIIPNNCSLAKENNVVSGIEEKENKEAEWNLKAIEVDEVTKQDTVSLKKIKIAVLDSGVDYSENVNVVERKDFLGEDISPLFEDGTGHGTAVAAVIGSNGENDTIKGINPNVEIYSAKILDNNNKASIDRVVKAIDWAIEKKVNIINMSFGRKGDSVTLHNAIRRAKRAGILMIASSGNGGSSEEGNVEYPAAYDEVVAVGAVTPEGTLSDMTSTGDELELLAPGEYIKTTGWLDSECISSGTSFAVPHVTAIASLLWQKNFTKSAEYIRNLLRASAKTVTGEDGKEYSLVDYEYACKIYDEYNEQYTEGADAEDIIEEFENTDEADDYSDEVEGRWSRSKHESTVTYASNSAGGLTSTQKVMLNGQHPYNNQNAALIMMGVAMHVVADTFAHKAGINWGGTWRPLGDCGYSPDNTTHYPERWKCAKESCAWVLANWCGDCSPNYLDYDFEYANYRLLK